MNEERRSSGGPPPRGDDSGPRRSEGRFDRSDRSDRGDRGDRGERGGGGGRRPQRRRFVRRFHRRKVCRFCVAKTEYVDYKDARHLKRYISDRGKIMPRRMSGCCARHQRMLTTAVKRARNLAILPYKAQ